jgi:hypothetical protein
MGFCFCANKDNIFFYAVDNLLSFVEKGSCVSCVIRSVVCIFAAGNKEVVSGYYGRYEYTEKKGASPSGCRYYTKVE